MKRNWRRWPKRFTSWLFGSPFRRLPAPFGNTAPSDLQVFEAQADEAAHQCLGGVATTAPAHHATTRPARIDSSLERQ